MNCKISNWDCVYHACMTDECQKTEIEKHTKTFGHGKCEEAEHLVRMIDRQLDYVNRRLRLLKRFRSRKPT